MTDYTGAGATESAAVYRSQITTEEDARTIMLNGVSWGAVLAGVAFALIVQLLLSLLGIGIGIATLDPGTADNPAVGTFSIAAGAPARRSHYLGTRARNYAKQCHQKEAA